MGKPPEGGTWQPWPFDRWHPDVVGSHLFTTDEGQHTDITRKAEHGFAVDGKFHVYHTHPDSVRRCPPHSKCTVFGPPSRFLQEGP